MGRTGHGMAMLLAAAGLSIAAAPAGAQTYQQAIAAADPTAYFRLTAPSTPSSDGAYTTDWQGSVVTGPGAPLASDPGNTGAMFNGANGTNHGIVETGLSGQVPGTGTIIAWVNLAALPSAVGHIQYVAGESQGGNDFDLQFASDNRLNFYTGGGENTSYAPDTASLAGQWHMIAATYDGTQGANSFRNIYWDGALGAGFTGGVNGAAKSNPFTIGYSNVFGDREFNGAIDEVAVFDHALGADQIASLYAARLDAGGSPAVPEPASWAMLTGGVGAAGGMVRRRRSTPAHAALA